MPRFECGTGPECALSKSRKGKVVGATGFEPCDVLVPNQVLYQAELRSEPEGRLLSHKLGREQPLFTPVFPHGCHARFAWGLESSIPVALLCGDTRAHL